MIALRINLDSRRMQRQLLRAGRDMERIVGSWLRFTGTSMLTEEVAEMPQAAAGEQWRAQRSGPLRVYTGRLAASLLGRRESMTEVKKQGGNMVYRRYTSVPYAGIQFEGGEIPISDRQRGFFWHKYKETKDRRWAALARKAVIIIPPRGTLRTAQARLHKYLPDLERRLGEVVGG